jgi:hypothetical protein
MKLPVWYKRGLPIWLFAAPGFWWFATGFNGLSFFSFPGLNGPEMGAGWQIGLVIQIGIYALLLFPVTALPIAVVASKSSNRHGESPNAPN